MLRPSTRKRTGEKLDPWSLYLLCHDFQINEKQNSGIMMNFELLLTRDKEKSIICVVVEQRSPGEHPPAGQGRSVNVCVSVKEHGAPIQNEKFQV